LGLIRLSNVKRLKIAATAASLRTAHKQDNPKLLEQMRGTRSNGRSCGRDGARPSVISGFFVSWLKSCGGKAARAVSR